jgi:hypothetical protein
MVTRNKDFITPSRTSPKGGSRGCVCADNTYSSRCCDGSIMAQGLGIILRIKPYLILENGSKLLQENNSKIIV